MINIKSKKIQCGLSLLMTMIVVAVIGILAEITLKAYETSVAQEQAVNK